MASETDVRMMSLHFEHNFLTDADWRQKVRGTERKQKDDSLTCGYETLLCASSEESLYGHISRGRLR